MVVDPDPAEQQSLSILLSRLHSGATIVCFSDPLMAVKFGANNPVDALYAVTVMRRLDGFALGKMLRGFQPKIQLHFIADDETGRRDAMRILADSCIVRPVTAESIRRAETEEW